MITSIEGSHRYDEIHVPWVVGLTSFRPHLLNKLKKMGYRLNEAVSLLYRCVHKYDPLIERLLNELIQEAGPSGIPVQMQRNGIGYLCNRRFRRDESRVPINSSNCGDPLRDLSTKFDPERDGWPA